jgi:hypothetical protein
MYMFHVVVVTDEFVSEYRDAFMNEDLELTWEKSRDPDGWGSAGSKEKAYV